MSAKDFSISEQAKLRELQEQVVAAEKRCEQLSQSPQVTELARVYLAGGRIYHNAGNLFQLQAAKMQLEILTRACEIQTQRVATCNEIAVAEEKAELIARRAEIAEELAQGAQRLVELAASLRKIAPTEEVQREIEKADVSSDARNIVQRLIEPNQMRRIIPFNRAA